MHVEHVPPFYNSKYDLSKWFQCSRSQARMFRYNTVSLTLTQTLSCHLILISSIRPLPLLYSDFGIVSPFSDSFFPTQFLSSLSLTSSLAQRLRQFCYGRCFLNDIFFMHFTSAIHCIICTLHILLSLPLFQATALLLTHFANCAYRCTCIHKYTCSSQLAANLRWTNFCKQTWNILLLRNIAYIICK